MFGIFSLSLIFSSWRKDQEHIDPCYIENRLPYVMTERQPVFTRCMVHSVLLIKGALGACGLRQCNENLDGTRGKSGGPMELPSFHHCDLCLNRYTCLKYSKGMPLARKVEATDLFVLQILHFLKIVTICLPHQC